MENTHELLGDVTYSHDTYECVRNAHAVVIVTEWDAFRALDLARMKSIMASPVLIDLRNIYRAEDVVRHGFVYADVGRGTAASVESRGDVGRAA